MLFSFWMLCGVDTVYSLGNMITGYIEGFEALHERELSTHDHLISSFEVALLKFGHLFHQLPKCEKTRTFKRRYNKENGAMIRKYKNYTFTFSHTVRLTACVF